MLIGRTNQVTLINAYYFLFVDRSNCSTPLTPLPMSINKAIEAKQLLLLTFTDTDHCLFRFYKIHLEDKNFMQWESDSRTRLIFKWFKADVELSDFQMASENQTKNGTF